jgi:hypothetical protein
MVIADVILAAVAPIGFIKRNLVAAWNALYFLIAYNDSSRRIVLDGSGILAPSGRLQTLIENRIIIP